LPCAALQVSSSDIHEAEHGLPVRRSSPLIFAVASTSWLSVVRGAGLVERRGLNRAHSVTFLKRLYSYYRAALEPIGKELIVFGCHIDHAACDSNCGSYVNA